MTADIPPNTMLWDGPAAARSVAADLIDKSRTSFETTDVTEKDLISFAARGSGGTERFRRRKSDEIAR